MALISVGLPIAHAESLRIGTVSDNPKQHYNKLKPIVDYIASYKAVSVAYCASIKTGNSSGYETAIFIAAELNYDTH